MPKEENAFSAYREMREQFFSTTWKFDPLTKLILLANNQAGVFFTFQGRLASDYATDREDRGRACTSDPPAWQLQGFKTATLPSNLRVRGSRVRMSQVFGEVNVSLPRPERDGSHLLNRLTLETLDGNLQ